MTYLPLTTNYRNRMAIECDPLQELRAAADILRNEGDIESARLLGLVVLRRESEANFRSKNEREH